MEFYERLGINLKSIRERRSLSIDEVAQLIGITPDAVRKYERGERRVPLDVLISGCAILGCSIMSALQGLDPRVPDIGTPEYNVLSPGDSEVMRYLASGWDGDIHALVVADALYASLPSEYRRECIMHMLGIVDDAISAGDISTEDLPRDLAYMQQALGRLYDL